LKEKCSNKVKDFSQGASLNGKGSMVITGWKLIRRQFLALFIKRFHHARRSRKGLIAQLSLLVDVFLQGGFSVPGLLDEFTEAETSYISFCEDSSIPTHTRSWPAPPTRPPPLSISEKKANRLF
ncbi:hypothetical protein ATANTOWER_017879, partial [Ataeniobius toweri]|nr:hypothetical protein [Ataeniobius toweri]